MANQQREPLPKSPAELAGLVFDVPCLACGKNAFTVPYVANAHHVLTCPACKAEIWVLIDESGGIKYFEKGEALKKIQRAKNRGIKPLADNAYYSPEVFEVEKSVLIITWQPRWTKNNEAFGSTHTTSVDWTSA